MDVRSFKILDWEWKGCQKKLLENDVTYLNYSLLPSYHKFSFCNEIFHFYCDVSIRLLAYFMGLMNRCNDEIYKYLKIKWKNIKKHFILDVLMKKKKKKETDSEVNWILLFSFRCYPKIKIYDFPLSVLSSGEIKNIIILMFSVRVVLFQ